MPDPVVLPLHPRTRARLEAAGLLAELEAAPGVRLVPPLGYLDFTALLLHARAVLTDSGGVQKEAYLAGRAVRDASGPNGVDGDRRRRAGTCSWGSTRTPRGPRWSASARPSARRCTATGARASASSQALLALRERVAVA